MLALAAAGLGLTHMFERHIERREALSLQAKARELLGGLRVDTQGNVRVDTYPSDNRFNRPAGGLYWQVSTTRGSVHSPSLWDQSLATPTAAPRDEWATRRVAGPYSHGILAISRIVQPDTGSKSVLVQLATDDDALVVARREFGEEMLVSLSLLWVALMVAAYLQVSLGLRPLARVRDDLERLRRNPGARLDASYLSEIRPLTNAINALVEARSVDLARARTRASDLAHSLKTPLAALSALSRRAREAGAGDVADGLDRTISAASAALESELARAKAALARERGAEEAVRLLPTIDRIVGVIERTDAGERVAISIDVPEDFFLPVPESELTEILGALVENAARHARFRVALCAREEDGRVTLSVADDGPGLSGKRPEQVLARGERLDQTGAGHGFGLSIVRDHVAATDGDLQLLDSDLGGLEVRLSWNQEV